MTEGRNPFQLTHQVHRTTRTPEFGQIYFQTTLLELLPRCLVVGSCCVDPATSLGRFFAMPAALLPAWHEFHAGGVDFMGLNM